MALSGHPIDITRSHEEATGVVSARLLQATRESGRFDLARQTFAQEPREDEEVSFPMCYTTQEAISAFDLLIRASGAKLRGGRSRTALSSYPSENGKESDLLTARTGSTIST